MAHEFTTDDCLDIFVTLSRLAKLKQSYANRFDNMALDDEASTARERAVRYTAECIAQDIYKRQPAPFVQTFRLVLAPSAVSLASTFSQAPGHCTSAEL